MRSQIPPGRSKNSSCERIPAARKACTMTMDLFGELYRRGIKLRRDELVEAVARSENMGGQVTLEPAPQERHDPFPLTDIQHAYWVGRSPAVELGGNSTHGYMEFDATDLDIARLNGGLNKVIQRHDMLRAIIGHDG